MLDDLEDAKFLTHRLVDGKLSRAAASRLLPHFQAAAGALRRAGVAGEEVRAFFVPGRLEVLGKHTDYAGGRSLVCAVERGFCVVAAPHENAPRETPRLQVIDVAAQEETTFALSGALLTSPRPWSRYPATVVRRAARDFGKRSLRGGVVAFSSNLPPAAGMSSSSALIISCFLALRALGGLHEHPSCQAHLGRREKLAQYLGAVEGGRAFEAFSGGEEEGVGTRGGSQDHTAILCSAPGALRQFAYRPPRLEQSAALPAGYVFVVAASGVEAEKTGAAKERYNRASRLAEAAAAAWCEATGRRDPHLGAVVAREDFSPSQMRSALRQASVLQQAESHAFSTESLVGRFEHFFAESSQIVPAAVAALQAGDVERFGTLARQSQRAAERLLGNQVPETVFLAEEARRLGAVAASAFGAGFGGAVWALVRRGRAKAFKKEWKSRYCKEFPTPAEQATFLAAAPGPAAFQL